MVGGIPPAVVAEVCSMIGGCGGSFAAIRIFVGDGGR